MMILDSGLLFGATQFNVLFPGGPNK